MKSVGRPAPPARVRLPSRASVEVEQLVLIDRMLKRTERRLSFRVTPRHRVGYVARLYNCAAAGVFRTQEQLDAFMLQALRDRAGTSKGA